MNLTPPHELNTDLPAAAYSKLLEDARQVSQKIRERFRNLQERFPGSALEEANNEAFLSEFPDRERRSVPRSQGSPVRVEVWAKDAPEEIFKTLARDCSETGLGIWMPKPVTVGTLLEIRLTGNSGSTSLIRVRHCHFGVGGWLVGCELVDKNS